MWYEWFSAFYFKFVLTHKFSVNCLTSHELGGSSGSALSIALQVAKDLNENQTCVFLCPDSIRNYMYVSAYWI